MFTFLSVFLVWYFETLTLASCFAGGTISTFQKGILFHAVGSESICIPQLVPVYLLTLTEKGHISCYFFKFLKHICSQTF